MVPNTKGTALVGERTKQFPATRSIEELAETPADPLKPQIEDESTTSRDARYHAAEGERW